MAELSQKLGRLRAFSLLQWRVFLHSLVVLPLAHRRLRRDGYRKTAAWALTKARDESTLTHDAKRALARDMAVAVNAAAAGLPGQYRCLARSLALGRFLARHGVPFEVRLGIPADPALDADLFSAHAWVECHGEVVNDRADIAADFVPFDAGGARP